MLTLKRKSFPFLFLLLVILVIHPTKADNCTFPYNTIGTRCCLPATISGYCQDEHINFENKISNSIFRQYTTRTNTLLTYDNISFDAPPHYLLVKDTFEGGLFRPYYFVAFGEDSRQRVRTDKQIMIAVYLLDSITWKKLLVSHPTKKLKRTHRNYFAYVTENYQKNMYPRMYSKKAIFRDRPVLLKYNSQSNYKYYVKDFDMILNTLEFR